MTKQETKRNFADECIRINRMYRRGMLTCFDRVEALMKLAARHKYNHDLIMIAEAAIISTRADYIEECLLAE